MSTEPVPGFSRKNPFSAQLKANRLLTLGESHKETRHYELSTQGSGLLHEAGDALGIYPSNDPALVSEILKTLKRSGEEIVVNAAGNSISLRQALTTDYIVTSPSKSLLQAIAEKDASATFLKELINPAQKTSLDQYLWGRDVLDILLEYPEAQFTVEELLKALRKLQPRLYSIASSRYACPDEVHLTVASVRYQSQNRHRQGVCSTYLADRVQGSIPIFIHAAKHFRLPDDSSAPIIMVGPGTGVAPFRAFLQERQALGAKGKNWLFFGEQHAASNFFYKDELESFLEQGLLTRLDTAFSRDQDYKIYVQHRLLEASKELWSWLEQGAYFYVCGDATRMARDVDGTLHTIVEKEGGMTADEAKEYIATMKKEKRYRKDVY